MTRRNFLKSTFTGLASALSVLAFGLPKSDPKVWRYDSGKLTPQGWTLTLSVVKANWKGLPSYRSGELEYVEDIPFIYALTRRHCYVITDGHTWVKDNPGIFCPMDVKSDFEVWLNSRPINIARRKQFGS